MSFASSSPAPSASAPLAPPAPSAPPASSPWPWYARALVGPAGPVREHLERVREAGIVPRVPNEWQLCLGVLRMWHRVLFRSETVGTCAADPVRPTLRARLLEHRALRLPVLLAERAVAPLDFTGLASSPERVVRHLLGAHHDGAQFVYDLQMLGCYPGGLEAALRGVRAVLASDSPRARFLRDLTVYQNYHERLERAVEGALRGEFAMGPGDETDPDISFTGYLRWCAAQPETPGETLTLMARGAYTIADGRLSC